MAPEEIKDFSFDLVSGSWFCPTSSLEGFWFLLRPVRKADRNRSDTEGRSRTREKSGWTNRLQDKSFYTPLNSWSGEVKWLDVETPSPRSGVDSAGRGTTGSAPGKPSVATTSFLGWLRPPRCIFGRERNFSGFMSSFDRWRWWDDKRCQLALLVAQIPFLADAQRRVGYRRDTGTPATSLGDVSFNFPLHAQATLFGVTSTFPSLSEILAASNNSSLLRRDCCDMGLHPFFPHLWQPLQARSHRQIIHLTKPNRDLFTT